MKDTLLIRQVLLGELENFTYILGDRASGEAFVIDPAAAPGEIFGVLEKEKLHVKGVLLTHGHYDHAVGLAHYDVPVYLSRAEAAFYTPRTKQIVRTADGATIALGEHTIECLHAPGHTPGCQCFFVEGNLFTGDVLFVDAVGRTDLPGGSSEVMFRSLQRIKELPDAVMVWPGHHYGAASHETLGKLKKHNPFLACSDSNGFTEMLG